MDSMPANAVDKASLLKAYKSRVDLFLAAGAYETALFWADKCVCLSTVASDSYAYLARVDYVRCLIRLGQFDRGVSFLRREALDSHDSLFRYYALLCLHHSENYEDALALFEEPFVVKHEMETPTSGSTVFNVESATSLLMGHVHEAMDNRKKAIRCYKDALESDVHCYEALTALARRSLISPSESRDLVNRLKFELDGVSFDDIERTKFLYNLELNKFADVAPPPQLPQSMKDLEANVSYRIALAERKYYNDDFNGAYAVTNAILQHEQLQFEVVPVHVCILVELNKFNKLFSLAHRLVDLYPDKPVSWFAVGAYYYAINSQDFSKRFFHKCTIMAPRDGTYWVCYGHAFAAQSEHDQAMNCYLRSAKVMAGCHLPLLYIGLEYCLTNNNKLGENFLNEAHNLAPADPKVLHELAVMAYKTGDFKLAETFAKDALERLRFVHKSYATIPVMWESLLNNLGHICRRLKHYEDAIAYHQMAILLCPQSSSSLAAIGMNYLLKRDVDKAIDFFHRSLSIRRENKFVSSLLTKAMSLSEKVLISTGFMIDFDEVPKLDLVPPRLSIGADLTSSMVMDDASMALSTPGEESKGTLDVPQRQTGGNGGTTTSESILSGIDSIDAGDTTGDVSMIIDESMDS